MEDFKTKVNAAVKTNNHRALLNLMNNTTYGSRIPTSLFEDALLKKFHDLIMSYSQAPILVKRNVDVQFIPYSRSNQNSFAVKFINRINSELIAEVKCQVRIYVKPKIPKSSFSIEISSGHTENKYSKSGNSRPANNSPGYGTIIRAFICAAAKKLGAIGVTQTSAYMSNKNKAAALAGTLKQPVSAYIMNKLGFNKNTNRNNSNTLAPHSRQLLFKNVKGDWSNIPTPSLNAVMNGILHKK